MSVKIRGYHIDANGHLNHVRYIRFMEEARWDYLDQHAELARLFAVHDISHATVHLRIDYHHPAALGDSLRIETGVVKKSRRSVTFGQKLLIEGSGRIASDAQVVNVYFIRSDGQPLDTSSPLFSNWKDLKLAPLGENGNSPNIQLSQEE
ncbi:MAG: acyl-CoA thioesterase [Desulfobacterales bacterium]|nr:acyl-CoA thioesterase [Desulfobacterales bacterium]